jgi:hypothetical protein
VTALPIAEDTFSQKYVAKKLHSQVFSFHIGGNLKFNKRQSFKLRLARDDREIPRFLGSYRKVEFSPSVTVN